MVFNELNKLLIEVGTIEDKRIKDIKNVAFKVSNLPFLKLRDILLTRGQIFLEDLEKQIYCACINGGFGRLNPVLLVVQLKEDYMYISIYAREGLIKQHTSEGVLDEIRESLKNYIYEE